MTAAGSCGDCRRRWDRPGRGETVYLVASTNRSRRPLQEIAEDLLAGSAAVVDGGVDDVAARVGVRIERSAGTPLARRPRRPARRRSSPRGTAPTRAARWRRTAGSASARTPAEGLRCEAGHLVRRHVADVLVDRPAVPERVDELAGPLAPERVVQRLELGGALAPAPVAIPRRRPRQPDGAPRRCRPASAARPHPGRGTHPRSPSCCRRSAARWSCTCPPGRVIRLDSTAPRTEPYQAAAATGFRVTRWQVSVLTSADYTYLFRHAVYTASSVVS